MPCARVTWFFYAGVEAGMSRLTAVTAGVLGACALFAWAPSASAQFLANAGGDNTPPALARHIDHPVSAHLLATLERASRAGLKLTTAPAPNILVALAGPRLDTGKKVGLLYIGADFCPYCAGQRWGLVLTLLRFGKFSGLRYMLSSPSDIHPDTPTVTFQHAHYASNYVAFQPVETADRDRNALATPDKQQMDILMTYDAPPYVRFAGSIPFVYLDGRYMLGQLLVAPESLAGKDWQQVADLFADAHSPLFHHVMPRVNLLTAAICRLDGGKPAHVCTAPGVRAAARELQKPAATAH